MLIRPDDVVHDEGKAITAIVLERAFRGATNLYTLETDTGIRLLSLMPSRYNYEAGSQVGVRLDLAHLAIFNGSVDR